MAIMRNLVFLLAMSGLLAASSYSLAQSTFGGTSSTGSTGGIGSGSGIGIIGRTGSASGTGGTGFSGGSGFSGGTGQGTAFPGFGGGLGATGQGAGGRTAGTAAAVSPTTINPYYAYYVNFYGLGLKPSTTNGVPPLTNNGFGKPIFAVATTGTGALGNLGGLNTNSGFGFTTFGMPRGPSFVTTLHNKVPLVAYVPAQLQADLKQSLENAGYIGSKRLNVAYSSTGAIILQGQVQDAEERRLVEGMMWLTPGVRNVQNELTFPTPTKNTPE